MKDFVEIDDDSYTFNTMDNNRDRRNNDFLEKTFPKKYTTKEKNFSNRNSFFSEKYKKKENLREFGEIKDFKEQIKEKENTEDNFDLQKKFFAFHFYQ